MTPRPQYDVVLVGAGTTGSILANKLGQAGLRVLVLDVGDRSYFTLDGNAPLGTDRRQPLLDAFYASPAHAPQSPYPVLPYAPMELENKPGAYYTGAAYTEKNSAGNDPPQFKSTYTRIVGGTMHHWLGTALRYVPSTFKEKTFYDRAIDWPIDYATLEDWYWKAENEIGVSGDSSQDLGSPRAGKPYPMPKILPSYMDQRIAAATEGMTFDGQPVVVQSTPQARNSVPFQDRPPCSGADNCIPICPIQAKYDATVHLKRALNPALDPTNRAGSVAAELRHHAVVTRVVVDATTNQVSHLVYKHPDGSEHSVTARRYVLAAHAMENAKILLCSPWGNNGHTVANSSDAVGRYLMDHNIKILFGKVNEPLYPFRGPKSTSGVETLRDGPFRRTRAAFRVEIQNVSANWGNNTPYSNLLGLLRHNVIGQPLYDGLGWDVARTMQIDALLEPDPQRDSTIRPSKTQFDALGVPRPELHFVVDEYTQRGAAAFETLAKRIYAKMGCRPEDVTVLPGFGGAGHVMGTHRMGDKADSVTDSFGRTHDHANLYLTGSGLFPTVDSANPTLTIVAVTLRQADHLVRELTGA